MSTKQIPDFWQISGGNREKNPILLKHQISMTLHLCLIHFYFYHTDTDFPPRFSRYLLHLLSAGCKLQWYGFTPQPESNKCYPSRDGNYNSCNPGPGSTNDPTPWPFIMCKMPDANSVLFFDVGEERSLVVDFEVENTMLVWKFEACRVDG